MAGRLFLTREIFFKRSHSCVYKQNRFVIYRHEREALVAKMTFRFEKRKIFLLTAIPMPRMRKPRNTKRHGADLPRNSVSLMK